MIEVTVPELDMLPGLCYTGDINQPAEESGMAQYLVDEEGQWSCSECGATTGRHEKDCEAYGETDDQVRVMYLNGQHEGEEDWEDQVRGLLIEMQEGEEWVNFPEIAPDLHELLSTYENLLESENPADREFMTNAFLAESLCPIHQVDYAICFDDEDPECAQVRVIHPGHDT